MIFLISQHTLAFAVGLAFAASARACFFVGRPRTITGNPVFRPIGWAFVAGALLCALGMVL